MLRNIMIMLITVILVGCGSTSKTATSPAVQNNKGVEKLVKYSILEPELAEMMALKAAQNRLDKRNASKDSPLSALTGDGSLVDGYLLSSVLGALQSYD